MILYVFLGPLAHYILAIVGFFLGAFVGALQARRRGGKGIDMAHYAAIYGIAGGILGTLVTVILSRTM